MVGQFADKTNRIRQQQRHILDGNLPYGRIQRGEKFIFGKHLRLAQQVHQGGLPDIRITHQSHPHQLAPVLALYDLLAVYFCQLFFQAGNLVPDNPPVGLYFRLPRSPQADTSLLPFQVSPHPRQARQQVLVLCQFHLRLGMCRPRPAGKNVQNQVGTVQYLDALEDVLNITQLGRGQFIIKNNHIHLMLFRIGMDFLQLAFPDKSGMHRLFQILSENLHRLRPCRLCQK